MSFVYQVIKRFHSVVSATCSTSQRRKKKKKKSALPHLSLLMLGDEVAVEVLQGHFGHGDPLLGVVTHGGAWALAGHCHAFPGKTRNQWALTPTQYNTSCPFCAAGNVCPISVLEQNAGILKKWKPTVCSIKTYLVVMLRSDVTTLNCKMELWKRMTVGPGKEEGRPLGML